MTPNMVTLIGAVGACWPSTCSGSANIGAGIAAGFVFMVLDTVDGKLARCTGASSKWGNVFDHGIDLIHPPFWWWAWAHGLAAYGRPLEPVYGLLLLAIVGGYVAQRLIEGIFMRRYGMHIHVWRPIDSKFRLITARRNPNMVILFAALAVPAARHRARTGRVVDPRLADLPRRAAGAGQRRAVTRAADHLLAVVTGTGPRSCLPGRGPARISLPQSHGTDLKALIPVGGKPMVVRPVAALLASPQVGRVRVLAQQADRIARGPAQRSARRGRCVR